MKRMTLGSLCLIIVILFSIDILAADYVVEADKLFNRGGLLNYKQAIEFYKKALVENPANYEANWKCARAHREYGETAKNEKVDPEFVRRGIAKGRIIIPKSIKRELETPIGFGQGLLVKINANVGSSKTICNVSDELEKAKIAVKYGADTVMDLSTGVTEEDVGRDCVR